MSSIKLSENFIKQAEIAAKKLNKSIAGQIEYWAKIGKMAEKNPDLNYNTIKNILIAEQEALAKKLEQYNFDD